MRDSNIKLRAVVADDHPVVRDGLVRALWTSGSIEVVAQAGTGREALAAIRKESPDVALIDFHMPDLDGAQVAAAIARDNLPTRVLLVSAHTEPAIVFNSLQQGSHGYVTKNASRSEIVDAVITCAAGKFVLAPELAGNLVGEIQLRREATGPILSPREREVLEMMAQGMSVPAMASVMILAPSTVKTHVQRLYQKLGVADRAAAVAQAMRHGMLE